VDAEQALADLTEISSQIKAAALIGAGGEVSAATLGDDAGAREFARVAQDLLAAAAEVRSGGAESLTQLEVATDEGSVFVVKGAGATIAATTTPEPTVGLVFYDLKSCLKSVAEDERPAEAEAKPKRPRRKKEDEEAPEDAS
jgi:predicted regulator of Ras-like GTPase activity (Roadblock/LC7/MglB family)